MERSTLGFAFPFRIDRDSGAVATTSGESKLRDNLLFLLQVELGERVLDRQYGAGLRGLLYEPQNNAFLGLLKSQIIRAISVGEPRIQPADLQVVAGAEPGSVEVRLLYVVKGSQQLRQVQLVLDPSHSGAGTTGTSR